MQDSLHNTFSVMTVFFLKTKVDFVDNVEAFRTIFNVEIYSVL